MSALSKHHTSNTLGAIHELAERLKAIQLSSLLVVGQFSTWRLNALRKSGCSSIKTREKYTPRGE